MLKDSVTKVTITSSANRSLDHLQSPNSGNKHSYLLETSFSSFLDRYGGTFEKRIADSSKSFNSFTSYREDDLIHMGKRKGEDEEIGVFSADKYFNGAMEDSPRVSNNMPARKIQYHNQHHHHPHQKEKLEADLEETRKSKVLSGGSLSVHSESSWNSQSALLKTSLKNSSSSSRKKVQGKSLLANLGCKCSCSDKDSVDVRSTASGEISFRKNASFGAIHGKASNPKKSFETVYSGLANQLVNMQLQPESEVEKPRKSLEVFGSPILESRSKSLSFDKALTLPSSSSWNQHVVAAPKSEEMDLSANSAGNYISDAASDASSDLFEIESFTRAKSKPYLARQASDAANSGCVTPASCYAPSEASIEWSVVTASAAEYSILSDCEEQRSVATMRSPIRSSTNGKNKANRDMQRRRSGNLLGCKSHKAVRVAGDAFIRHQKASLNIRQVTKMASFDPRHGGQQAYGSQKPRQRSHSPNASQVLYV